MPNLTHPAPWTRHKLILIMPVLLWCGVLFFLSSRPASSLPPWNFFPHQDKLVHGVLYFPLGLLLCRFLTHSPRTNLTVGSFPPRLSTPARAIVLGVVYGLSDEIHQLFVPGRAFDLLDLAADAVGVALGAFTYQTWATSRKVSHVTSSDSRAS